MTNFLYFLIEFVLRINEILVWAALTNFRYLFVIEFLFRSDEIVAWAAPDQFLDFRIAILLRIDETLEASTLLQLSIWAASLLLQLLYIADLNEKPWTTYGLHWMLGIFAISHVGCAL